MQFIEFIFRDFATWLGVFLLLMLFIELITKLAYAVFGRRFDLTDEEADRIADIVVDKLINRIADIVVDKLIKESRS